PLDIQIVDRTDRLIKAKVLPLWHGSKEDKCKSIIEIGFTSYGKHHYFNEDAKKGSNQSTDMGYYGSGIYFTDSARYAAMYGNGLLFLTWVSMREPFPVVSDVPHPEKSGDMRKLEGREHYQNYNAHFISVAPINPSKPQSKQYYPCYKDQTPSWNEIVVFDK